MNKKELENEIMKTQEQLEKLKTALKYVDGSGNICWTNYIPMLLSDITYVYKHRAFLSEEYAEAFAKKTQIIADMLHFKYLYDRDYKPDWGSEDEQKFCVYYNNKTKKFECSFRTMYLDLGSIFFSTRELAERCADWLNKKYN